MQRELIVTHAERHDAFGVGDACRIEQNLVHYAEDGGVGADSQRESGDGYHRITRGFGEGTDGVAGIFPECGHNVNTRSRLFGNAGGQPLSTGISRRSICAHTAAMSRSRARSASTKALPVRMAR